LQILIDLASSEIARSVSPPSRNRLRFASARYGEQVEAGAWVHLRQALAALAASVDSLRMMLALSLACQP